MKKVRFEDLILVENDNYIIINKPPFISTLDERHNSNTVNINSLAKAYSPALQICHRLDKETSGALAIAKNSEAYRNLAIQFEKREVTKIYHAVVDGMHDFEGISVYLPILQLSNGLVKIDKVRGKLAETIFNTVKVYKKYTLLECMPITGRMHQIRAHLTCLNAPIVCDTSYGGKNIYLSELKKNFNLKQETEELPLIKRVALHAYSLQFSTEDEEMNVEAPYPNDFGVLVKQLEKYG